VPTSNMAWTVTTMKSFMVLPTPPTRRMPGLHLKIEHGIYFHILSNSLLINRHIDLCYKV